MFGNWRRGRAVLVPAVASLVLLLAPRHAFADSAQDAGTGQQGTLFGLADQSVTPTEAESNAIAGGIGSEKPISLDRVWAEDFHPETDRWTERNNRIKISVYGSGLFFSQNLRIAHDAAYGIRLAWEVPGFIGIRFDTVADPWSRLRVRATGALGQSSLRTIKGVVDCTSVSIAIFNPELSYPANLAMWAGLGLDAWIYHYSENDISFIGQRYVYQDYNAGLNFFFDLEYKVADIFHVGFFVREHLVYAPQTELGEFYHVNGHTASNNHHGRNASRPWDISPVEEIGVTMSVLF
jgi:hypothetical protein